MKKIIIFIVTLTGVAATPLMLFTADKKNTTECVQASTRYKELSTALRTNRILQVTILREIKHDSSATQKLRKKQFRNLQINEKLLRREMDDLLRKCPKLRRAPR